MANQEILPEGGSTADKASLVTRETLDGMAAKERMMFEALLPEVLTIVSRLKVKLDNVFVVTLAKPAKINNSNKQMK